MKPSEQCLNWDHKKPAETEFNPFRACVDIAYLFKNKTKAEIFIAEHLNPESILFPQAIYISGNLKRKISADILTKALEVKGSARKEAIFYLSRMPNPSLEREVIEAAKEEFSSRETILNMYYLILILSRFKSEEAKSLLVKIGGDTELLTNNPLLRNMLEQVKILKKIN